MDKGYKYILYILFLIFIVLISLYYLKRREEEYVENFGLLGGGPLIHLIDDGIKLIETKREHSKLIHKKNPENSKVVIEQDAINHTQSHRQLHKTPPHIEIVPTHHTIESEKPTDDIYYAVKISVKPEMKYSIECWYSVTKDWDGKDNIINVVIEDKDNKNYVISGKEEIINKRKINGELWINLRTTFLVPKDSKDHAFVYFGYNPRATRGSRYITSLKLKVELDKDGSFPFKNNLNLLMYSSDINDNNLIWKDISGKKNNFKFVNKISKSKSGKLILTNNKAYGPNSQTLFKGKNNNGYEFTLMTKFELNSSSSEDYNDLLYFEGNQDASLVVKMSNTYNNLILMVSDKIIMVPYNVLPENTIILTLVVKNNQLDVYIGIQQVLKQKIDKLHFKGDSVINRSKNLHGEIENLIILDKGLEKHEIQELINYINYRKHDKENITYMFDDVLNNKYNDLHPSHSNTPFDNDKNRNSYKMVGQRCHDKCLGECESYLDTDEISKCLRKCKHKINECKEFCSYAENKLHKLCETNKEIKKDEKHYPEVSYNKGKYYVKIPKESKYAQVFGTSKKYYGSDRIKVKHMYEMNFPDVSVPKILKEGPTNKTVDSCPYVYRTNNPCMSDHCMNIDWSKDVKENNVSGQCKKVINHYCELNHEYDPACNCWNPEYENHPECVKHRKIFRDPGDYNCNINNFEIQEHPDYRNYIKKNRIPCWNCNLNAKHPFTGDIKRQYHE